MNSGVKNPKGYDAVSTEKKGRGRTTGVYVDMTKFNKLMAKFATQEEFAKSIGRSKAWVWQVQKNGTMAKVDAIAIKGIYKIDLEIPEPVEEPKVEAPQSISVNVDNSEVVKKMDELLVAINKLGNVQMQILEDIHKLTKELVK